MHIAIAGNIGAGKTTLASLLAKHYNWEAHFEKVDDNPYLSSFYQDMNRWAFNLQIFFLKSRISQILDIRKSNKNVIQDRTIYEDAYIFAPNLHEMGLMSSRDYNTYLSLFEIITEYITPPDLIIYLHASVPKLVSQIQKRGRPFENSIRIDYLTKLNERYEKWAGNYKLGKLITIDVDNNNFNEIPDDMNKVINAVNAQLYGLF